MIPGDRIRLHHDKHIIKSLLTLGLKVSEDDAPGVVGGLSCGDSSFKSKHSMTDKSVSYLRARLRRTIEKNECKLAE